MQKHRVSAVLFCRMSVAVLVAMLGLGPTLAFAAETRGGNAVVVGPGETIGDDLYVGAGTVTVLGTINGDLVVSGGTVTVSGPVKGDVIAAGGTTTLQGPVGRNVRVVGGTIVVANTVAQDVVVAGGNLTLGPQARVGRDLLAGIGTASIDGPVVRNVVANAGSVTLNAPVGGNVQFDGSTLTLGPQASIGGNLTYTSDNEVVTAGPVVKGRTVRVPRATTTASQSPLDQAVGGIVGWVRALVGLFALGLILVLMFPAFSKRTVVTLQTSPVASILVGLIALIVVPVAAIILFALGLVVGGWWLGLIALTLYGIALVVSLTVAALYVGTLIEARVAIPGNQLVWALLLGVAIILLVGLVPVVGGIVVFVALLFGLGSLLLAAYRAHAEPKRAAPTTDPTTT